MIIKVKPRKTSSFAQLLEYMLQGRGKKEERSPHDFIHTHNMRGDSLEEWVAEFEENEQFRMQRRSNSNILTHEILSWHYADTSNISKDVLYDITKQYIKERGINGMYVAIPHFDQEHVHVHLCVSGVEFRTGKSMRMSHKEFAHLKSNVQNYQIEKYPELEHSVVGHGNRISKDHADKLKQYNQQQKENLSGISRRCYDSANSLEQFMSLLASEGLEPYYRNGKLTGVKSNNRKYRLRKLGIGNTDLEKLDDRNERKDQLNRSRSTDKQTRSRSLDRDSDKGGFGGSAPEQDAN